MASSTIQAALQQLLSLFSRTNHTHSQYLTQHQDISGKANTSGTYSGLNVGYATSAGNADTIDSKHSNAFASAVTSTQRDFSSGTLIKTSLDYSRTSGAPFYVEIKGNVYGRSTSCFTQIQGYIWDNTIINYGVTHLGANAITGLIAMNLDGYLCFWFPRQGYWEGYSVYACAAGSSGSYNDNVVTSVTDSADPGGTKRISLNSNTVSSITTTGNQTINGTLYASSFQISSDRNLKENIKDAYKVDLSGLKPKTFTFKNDANKNRHYGLIAQEVEAVLPEAVSKDKNEHLSIDYSALTAALIDNFNKQQKQIEQLIKENEELKSRLSDIENKA